MTVACDDALSKKFKKGLGQGVRTCIGVDTCVNAGLAPDNITFRLRPKNIRESTKIHFECNKIVTCTCSSQKNRQTNSVSLGGFFEQKKILPFVDVQCEDNDMQAKQYFLRIQHCLYKIYLWSSLIWV
jgi:hypothetical protein